MTFGPHWKTPGWACNIQLGVVMQLRGIGSAAMVEILKFVRPETAFDPESIQALASGDQQMLVDDAVRFLGANYKDVGKQPA